ncbi:MAG TPA: bifunctional phosphoribosylaminoimidazolecarboxamide formyltransferase/IMP cyclohydrolase [Gemmatimonadales bacterium]|jgi:phosphoribosylaminoimidazolecarboxamide formyltransferase/IMP cyclohydrolase|nr:bifunctional phosphoribosylaminoimidazolecarboxamide formyltransferase/IMP cyclohydrolase [Gemmatimonadales bacterium]
MPRALISVSDKRGVVAFARGLVDLGWEIISTGGTAAALRSANLPVHQVEQLTGFPELLDGRVKTLHPAIHGALLARRDLPEHVAALQTHGIAPIDLVAVNLYPFQLTIAREDASLEDALENIDVGGPSMLRSAAKNHASVLPVVDPTDYTAVLEMLQRGEIDSDTRREFAAKVFAHTADYDAAIAAYLTPKNDGLPSRLGIAMERAQALRYGENPGQRAALYVTEEPRGMRDLVQRQGKELSFNNLLDIDAAMATVACWANRPACAIIKHTTPCGLAVAASAVEAFRKARATDPVSAFGSVVGFNTVVDRTTAAAMSDLFVEVVVAPSFHADALEQFAGKKQLRVVELPVSGGAGSLDFKRVRGGFLVQDQFVFDPREQGWTVATKQQPSESQWNDLRFGWAGVAAVKSNAILLAREEMAIGIGAGQMSRVDSVFLAVHKARQQGHDPGGSILASDAFFPFPDSIELAAEAGIKAIIQPGGSVRDQEVVAAADRLGMTMVVTGRRQFRH